MWKKYAVAGTAVAALAGGAVAVSSTEANAAPPAAAVSTTASSTAHKADGKRHVRLGRGVVYGSWVTKDKKTGALVTHDEIRGTVTAVSPTSITVMARNNVEETFAVNGSTKVRMRATKSAGTISGVHDGAKVVVIGTGTTSYTATRIDVAK
ncbi:hypothetical protein BKA23_0450 [Rudaeicoccus suwonensis]|uniref:DUF5666 domain-containing protein n=2 Tax=Rudaeicoccus suwonensis TaxID=657409 RepID=A0A561E7T1_9MICO|nr:hypothetical protein BKA23_0450 [Rudaeicoccus suwonensis]